MHASFLNIKSTNLCSFSDPFLFFLVLQCPSPPNIDGGNHDSQDVEVFLPGMAVNYSCDPGYSLLGEASIYCTESGNWSLPAPQCEGKVEGQRLEPGCLGTCGDADGHDLSVFSSRQVAAVFLQYSAMLSWPRSTRTRQPFLLGAWCATPAARDS